MMRPKALPFAILFLAAFTAGAFLGRRWQGTFADIVLWLTVLFAVALVALAAISRIPRPAGDEVRRFGTHLALERRGGKWVLRLQDFWRLEFVEVALALPRVRSAREILSDWVGKAPDSPPPPILSIVRRAIAERPGRLASLLAAAALTSYVLAQLPRMAESANYTLVAAVWILAFVCYAFAVAPPRARPRHDLRVWWRAHWKAVLVLSAIMLAAFLLRVWQIGTIPFVLAGDEATFGTEAMRFIRGERGNPFSMGALSIPTMSFLIVSVPIRWLGANAEAIRLPSVLFGTLSVLLTYWLVTRLSGPRLGFVTAALVAAYHFHIHFSRLAINNIADPVFTGLALLFLYRALDRKGLLDWACVGAVSALSFYFYAGARFTPVLVVTVLGYLLLSQPRRFFYTHRLGLVVALGAFLVVGAPMIQYAVRFPDVFDARVNQMGIFQSGWLEREPAIRGTSTAMVLWDQFLRAALAFNFYPDRSVWYGLSGPLLDPIFGALFLLGLGYATVRALVPGGDKRYFPMVAWWWGGMILGSFLTLAPPASMRLVTLTVPACFFIALAMWQLIRLGRKAVTRVPANALLVAGVFLFSFIGLKMYLVDFTPLRITGGGHAEISTEIAPIMQHLGQAYRTYFFAAPDMDSRFPTLTFLVPEADSTDVSIPLTTPPPLDWLPPERGALFVFLPRRIDELALVQQAFPNGTVQKIRRPSNQQVIVTLYQVPP